MSSFPSDISALVSSFEQSLARYPETSSALRDKDVTRYETLPKAIHASDRAPNGYLTSEELVELVEWKLKHGKFRPSLMKLAKENADDKVRNTSAAAFAHLAKAAGGKSGDDPPWKAVELAMSDIVELRGIGPATASLVLSCYDPVSIPFFSDELFRLFHWLDQPIKGKETGWDRKINYTMKEYRSLIGRINEFRGISEASGRAWDCTELERAAWVLGKEGQDVGVLLSGQDIPASKPVREQDSVGNSGPKAPAKVLDDGFEKRKRDSDHDSIAQPAKKSARSTRKNPSTG